jgi:hypothetical protein
MFPTHAIYRDLSKPWCHEMTWPNFKRLLKRVAREIVGLRAVRHYEVPGHAQDATGLANINPSGKMRPFKARGTKNSQASSIKRRHKTKT